MHVFPEILFTLNSEQYLYSELILDAKSYHNVCFFPIVFPFISSMQVLSLKSLNAFSYA